MINARAVACFAAVWAGFTASAIASLPAPNESQQASATIAITPAHPPRHIADHFSMHDSYRQFITDLTAEAGHTELDTLVSNYAERTKLDWPASQQLVDLTLDVHQQMTQKEAVANEMIQAWVKSNPTAAERRANPLPDSAKTLVTEDAALVEQFQQTLRSSLTPDDFNKVNSYISRTWGPDRKPTRRLTPSPGATDPAVYLPGTKDIRVSHP